MTTINACQPAKVQPCSMETTEKIVEAYVRYVKGWATIPNIKCAGQLEIDLLAIDPVTLARYQIESSVSGSQVYSKLTDNEFDPGLMHTRKAKMRRTLGYFIDRKFGPDAVTGKLKEYGFEEGHYTKIVVTWDWTAEAKAAADSAGIELWDFRQIARDIAQSLRDRRSYFTDDTLRTINLFTRAISGVEPEPEIESGTETVEPDHPHFRRRAD